MVNSTGDLLLLPAIGLQQLLRSVQEAGTTLNMFFHPDGTLYGVWYDGRLYKAPPPTDDDQGWIDRATLIGSGWDTYKFLFFHPSGLLYGVKDGKIYSGAPPTDPSVEWSADLVGDSGWDAFKFLFFDPNGMLYGVIDDDFRRGNPPTGPGSYWVANSQLLSSSGWNSFQYGGQLYGVHKDKLYKHCPQTVCFENWLQDAEVIGPSGWSQFTFLIAPLEFIWSSSWVRGSRHGNKEVRWSGDWLLLTVGLKLSLNHRMKCKGRWMNTSFSSLVCCNGHWKIKGKMKINFSFVFSFSFLSFQKNVTWQIH